MFWQIARCNRKFIYNKNEVFPPSQDDYTISTLNRLIGVCASTTSSKDKLRVAQNR